MRKGYLYSDMPFRRYPKVRKKVLWISQVKWGKKWRWGLVFGHEKTEVKRRAKASYGEARWRLRKAQLV